MDKDIKKYKPGDTFLVSVAEVYERTPAKNNERPQHLYRMRHFDGFVMTEDGLDRLERYQKPNNMIDQDYAGTIAYVHTIAMLEVLRDRIDGRIDGIKAALKKIKDHKTRDYEAGRKVALAAFRAETDELIQYCMKMMGDKK